MRMVLDLKQADPADHSVITRVARQLGVGAESLRTWVKQSEVDAGTRGASRPRSEPSSSSCGRRPVSCSGPTTWQVQAVAATSSANFSDGVMNPSVLRGRPLRLR